MEQQTCPNCIRVFYFKGKHNGKEVFSADREADINGAWCDACSYNENWFNHDAECHGTLHAHICTYYKQLLQSAYEGFWGWTYDGAENRILKLARNGPTRSRGKQRACRYCNEDISPGQPRYMIDRRISLHPECFNLHCLFIRQMMDEVMRHNLNFI